MITINDKASKVSSVECDFYVSPGNALTFILEGHTYPYTHQQDGVIRASDARYKQYLTPINSAITFDAIDSESLGHPKVVAPTGVSIIQYEWNFGDGIEGQGPITTHTYKVVVPEAAVILTVIDSRGRRYSCRRPLNLAFATEGSFAASRLRS